MTMTTFITMLLPLTSPRRFHFFSPASVTPPSCDNRLQKYSHNVFGPATSILATRTSSKSTARDGKIADREKKGPVSSPAV